VGGNGQELREERYRWRGVACALAPLRRAAAPEGIDERVIRRAVAVAVPDGCAHSVPVRVAREAEGDVADRVCREVPAQATVRAGRRCPWAVTGPQHVHDLVAALRPLVA